MEKGSVIQVACVQMKPVFGAVESNVEQSLEWIKQASEQGAKLIVLPELCNTGYVFHTKKEAIALSEVIPEGKTVQAWCHAAKVYGVYIVAGIAEKDGNSLYNAAVFIGPDGYIGTYRKNHLWNEEKLFFEPGNLGLPIFEIDEGKIGILICYDMWFPEVYRYYASQGVDLICIPTNWVPEKNQPEDETLMAVHIAMANAHCNSLFIACADRVGVERNQPFIGGSTIVDIHGWPVTGPADMHEEKLISATINLSEARTEKTKGQLNNILQDRRTDLYWSQ
ncbi:nitrilase family protein [Aquibacillus albus]|uniref:Amidohydrolase n=1 Tax=Aquibacillus albus TaxID=1168171 RepID=A0ABS2MWU2_9BACI|nr:nitrilase family protein [Aquibacillus albus]MBM7570165.1 putative amidohydrolase [Aquibacillus albus]